MSVSVPNSPARTQSSRRDHFRHQTSLDDYFITVSVKPKNTTNGKTFVRQVPNLWHSTIARSIKPSVVSPDRRAVKAGPSLPGGRPHYVLQLPDSDLLERDDLLSRSKGIILEKRVEELLEKKFKALESRLEGKLESVEQDLSVTKHVLSHTQLSLLYTQLELSNVRLREQDLMTRVNHLDQLVFIRYEVACFLVDACNSRISQHLSNVYHLINTLPAPPKHLRSIGSFFLNLLVHESNRTGQDQTCLMSVDLPGKTYFDSLTQKDRTIICNCILKSTNTMDYLKNIDPNFFLDLSQYLSGAGKQPLLEATIISQAMRVILGEKRNHDAHPDIQAEHVMAFLCEKLGKQEMDREMFEEAKAAAREHAGTKRLDPRKLL